MKICRCVLPLGIVLLVAAWTFAVDPPPLVTAKGTVEKVDANTLTIKPRGPDGKFGKNIVLKLTGTSKVTTLQPQMRKTTLVLTQKDTDAKDLARGQTIALVYTLVKDSPVLLTAVVQPAGDK